MQTRSEHLAWCKKEALEYCDDGDTVGALTSMFSDLKKHPETADHGGILIGIMLLGLGKLDTQADARLFIEGFN